MVREVLGEDKLVKHVEKREFLQWSMHQRIFLVEFERIIYWKKIVLNIWIHGERSWIGEIYLNYLNGKYKRLVNFSF